MDRITLDEVEERGTKHRNAYREHRESGAEDKAAVAAPGTDSADAIRTAVGSARTEEEEEELHDTEGEDPSPRNAAAEGAKRSRGRREAGPWAVRAAGAVEGRGQSRPCSWVRREGRAGTEEALGACRGRTGPSRILRPHGRRTRLACGKSRGAC